MPLTTRPLGRKKLVPALRSEPAAAQRLPAAVSSDLLNKLAHPQNLLEQATRAQIPAELLPRLITILGDAIWYAF